MTCKTGKIGYESAGFARKEYREYKHRGAVGTFHCYHCSDCDQYHVTSMKPSVYRAIQRRKRKAKAKAKTKRTASLSTSSRYKPGSV